MRSCICSLSVPIFQTQIFRLKTCSVQLRPAGTSVCCLASSVHLTLPQRSNSHFSSFPQRIIRPNRCVCITGLYYLTEDSGIVVGKESKRGSLLTLCSLLPWLLSCWLLSSLISLSSLLCSLCGKDLPSLFSTVPTPTQSVLQTLSG